MAARAEVLKEEKYSALRHSHFFTPIAVETSGVLGPRSLSFIKDLGSRMRSHSGDHHCLKYLLQRISMAVQRGNAISILDEPERVPYGSKSVPRELCIYLCSACANRGSGWIVLRKAWIGRYPQFAQDNPWIAPRRAVKRKPHLREVRPGAAEILSRLCLFVNSENSQLAKWCGLYSLSLSRPIGYGGPLTVGWQLTKDVSLISTGQTSYSVAVLWGGLGGAMAPQNFCHIIIH